MRSVLVCCLVCLALVASVLSAGEWTDAEKAQIQEIRNVLERPISIELVDLPVFRALELIARKTGVPITLAGPQQTDVFQVPISYSLDNVHGLDLLDVLCLQVGLECEFLPKEVRVHSARELRRLRMRLVSYALDDLTLGVNDRPAPDPLLWGARGGTHLVAPRAEMSVLQIADLIRSSIRPGSWDPTLGTSIEEKSGVLLINQTEDVQVQIRRLLAGLRARAGRQVSLEAWVYSVPSREVDRLWSELRARGGRPPQLDDAAVAEIRKWADNAAAQTLYSGSTVLYNRQCGYWGDMNQQTDLYALTVSGHSYEAMTRVVPHGTVIEARPILSDDGGLISLSVQAAHSQVAEKSQSYQVVRGGQSVSVQAEAKSPLAALRLPSYQVPLTATWRSRVSQDVVVSAGGHVALVAPLCDANGLALGREMLVLLRCRPLILQGPVMEPEVAQARPLPAALVARLEKKVTLTFVETPFEKALRVFSEQTGVPIVIDPCAALRQPTTMEAKDVPAGDALRLLLQIGDADIDPYPSLLLVTSRQRVAARRMTMRIFDLSDLNKAYPDYPAQEELQVQTVDPTAGGGNPFTSPADMTKGLAATDFAELFSKRLMAREFSFSPASIQERGGQLVVFHTPEVLARVERSLAEFRRTARKPIAVSGRWLVANLTDLKTTVGEDLPATLDVAQTRKAEALASMPGTRDIAAGRFTCFNNQRVSCSGGHQRSQVVNYHFSSDLPIPEIREFMSGAILDVTPLMMEGTGEQGIPSQLRLDVRATLAWADPAPPVVDPAMAEAGKPEDGAMLRPGNLQSSRLSFTKLGTSVRVVNGGAALFRFPVPAWVEGEDREKSKKGERVLVLLLRAEQ